MILPDSERSCLNRRNQKLVGARGSLTLARAKLAGARVRGALRARATAYTHHVTDTQTKSHAYALHPVGRIESTLSERKGAPRQGNEGAPDAWLEVSAAYEDALDGLATGDEVIVITWLHQGARDVLKVYPRDRPGRLTGVFATRSPDRPNPLGLHRVTVHEISGRRFRIGPIEAIDGTPVVDIKPVLPNGR